MKQITASVGEMIAEELEKKAEAIKLSKAKYNGIILTEWVESGKKLSLSE